MTLRFYLAHSHLIHLCRSTICSGEFCGWELLITRRNLHISLEKDESFDRHYQQTSPSALPPAERY